MKKTLVRYFLFIFLLLLGSSERIFAQQGFGTKEPSKASVVDMQSENRGLLIPRVALTSLTSFLPVTGETSTEIAKTNSLLVYNTADVNEDVFPGFYYWTTDGVTGQWNRLITLDEVPETIEPWNKQGTTDPATLNSDNIYQTGSVAIGKNSVFSTAKLDVAGAVRGGSNQQGVVGANSVAFGNMNTASGQNSVALGNMNVASANNSVVSGGMANQAQAQYAAVSGGNNNQAQAQWSVVSGGTSNVASGMYSIVSGGENNQAQGRWSVVAGGNSNYALSAYEWVGGAFSTSYAPNSQTNWDNDDRLFNIGNGDDMVRRDAFTILKNGKTGVGFSNFETVTFPQLFQVNGSVRITELYDEVGDVNEDKIVVVDEDGGLASIGINDITTTADNGLTKTANNIKLGGELENPTTITTDNSNTLAIQGLQTGNTNTDKMMVVTPDGVLKTVKQAPRFFYMPPVIFDTSNPGTGLTRDIYQDYVNQFTGVNPYNMAHGADGSGNGQYSMPYNKGLVKSPSAPVTIPVYGRTDLYYYIPNYDTTVFNNVSISDNGILTYDIIGTATDISSMTIVFQIKD